MRADFAQAAADPHHAADADDEVIADVFEVRGMMADVDRRALKAACGVPAVDVNFRVRAAVRRGAAVDDQQGDRRGTADTHNTGRLRRTRAAPEPEALQDNGYPALAMSPLSCGQARRRANVAQ